MKRKLQILWVSLILLFICFSFSGCNALDELRDKQAYITETRDIVYNQATFILMPENDILYPVFNYSSDNMLNITAKDVPVLLSPILSEKTAFMSEDGLFLYGYSEKDGLIYCREDKYEEMAARIKEEFKPDKACYFFDKYDSEKEEDITGHYVLSEEEYDAVKDIIKNTEASLLPAETYIDYDYLVYLELCSEDLLLRKYVMDIALSNNQYYIIHYSEDGSCQLFTVPEKYNHIFTSIMKSGIDAYRSYDSAYDEYIEEENL